MILFQFIMRYPDRGEVAGERNLDSDVLLQEERFSTLRERGIHVDEAFFLRGIDKGRVLSNLGLISSLMIK
jgi:hypothetical protein